MLLNSHPASKPAIHITEKDRRILQGLAFAALSSPDVADELLDELDRAQTVAEDKAKKYIGIGTKAIFTTWSGEVNTVELVMPAHADISVGKISVLTPIGVALLGLSAGQSISWTARDGRKGTLTVVEILK